MIYNRAEILEHKNPYELFQDCDDFAEHQNILNKALSKKEQEALAINIVAGCPNDKLTALQTAINALSDLPIKSENHFNSIIHSALQVKIRLMEILDSRNNNPHQFLIEEKTPDLFHRFKTLIPKILDGNEIAIAERLALFTPEEDRSKLARRLQIMFPKSQFVAEAETAFSLRRSIQLLLGERPEKFFIDRHFNTNNCLKFSNMVRMLLKGQEQKISEKLAVIDPKIQAEIQYKLERLTTTTYNTANPFYQIAKDTKISIGTNPNSLFNTAKAEHKKTTTSPLALPTKN